MKEIKIANNKLILLIILILTLQIIGIVYATSKREYYHIDEYYSHGLIQYKRAFIYENDDFLENWHNKEYFKDYLVINKEQALDFQRVYLNQAEDVHPPIYYLLLRIACSFNLNEFSIWPGTILNIIIFIISSIFLFLIAREIFKNDYIALLVLLVSGFSIGIIETVMYVRMYELLVLNILMLIFWHIRKKDKTTLTYKDLLPLYILIIFGFLTHYYYCIIACILSIMYVIKYIRKKDYKNIRSYLFTEICAVLTGIIIFPYSIYHIFFSYRGQEAVSYIKDLYFALGKLLGNIEILNKEILNGQIYILIAILLLLCIICTLKGKTNKEKKKNTNMMYVTIPTLAYLIIETLISPYIDLRYIMPVIPLIFILGFYMIIDLLQDIISNKKLNIVLIIISILFCLSVIPKLSDNAYLYKGYKEALSTIENNLKDIPCIYIYNDLSPKDNKIMQCYGALTKIEKTYIMPSDNVTKENIENSLKNIDTSNGVLILVDCEIAKQNIKNIMNAGLFDSLDYIGNLSIFMLFRIK